MEIAKDCLPVHDQTSRNEKKRKKIDDDILWLESQLKKLPIWTRNPSLCLKALEILRNWFVLFKSDFSTWRRIKKRIAKELNECEPCISYVMNFVKQREEERLPPSSSQNEKFTIVDLCSGFGICSMFLSELLPPELVDKIWLIDYNYGCIGKNPPHIQQIFYDREWPIPLRLRKTDIKKSRQIRQLHQRVLDPSPGPVILMGIHLCKALSVHAIKIYQSCPRAEALVLKPCCLPGKDNLNVRRGEPIMWKFVNGFEFGPRDLYCKEICEKVDNEEEAVYNIAEERKEEDSVLVEDSDDEDTDSVLEERPHGGKHYGRHYTNKLFSRWVSFLERGCKDDSTSQVSVKHVVITTHHFQNKFIYCERIKTNASTTSELMKMQ